MDAGLPWIMTREGGNHSIFTLRNTQVQIPRPGFDIEFEFINKE